MTNSEMDQIKTLADRNVVWADKIADRINSISGHH
jgi:hypothetical protein